MCRLSLIARVLIARALIILSLQLDIGGVKGQHGKESCHDLSQVCCILMHVYVAPPTLVGVCLMAEVPWRCIKCHLLSYIACLQALSDTCTYAVQHRISRAHTLMCAYHIYLQLLCTHCLGANISQLHPSFKWL